jgi:hypothetical protein
MNRDEIKSGARGWTPAQRAHNRRVGWALLAYALVLPPLVWFAAHYRPGTGVRLASAIVASLPLLLVFASWGRYLSEERDEYQRSVATGRVVIATNATMGTAVVWGFLQAFDVMPKIEMYWIAVVWVLIQGVAGMIAYWNRAPEGDDA